MNLVGLFGNIFGMRKPVEKQMNLRSGIGFNTKALEYQVWYNGETTSLSDFYGALRGTSEVDLGNRFWSASRSNSHIRKAHSGLPKLMVDRLAGIVVDDMLDPQLDTLGEQTWEYIQDQVKLKAKVLKATKEALIQGDGAFKISMDTDLADYPLVEFFDAMHTEYVYKYGILTEIVFKEEIEEGNNTYLLRYHYGYGYIAHTLHKVMNKEVEVPLNTCKATRDMPPVIDLAEKGLEDIMLAVPLMFSESNIYKGRGESIYAGKLEPFDSLDEVVSSWLDAIRSNRVVKYVPNTMIPRDAQGNRLLPDPFNQYVQVADQLKEGVANEVKIAQGDVSFEGYLSSYATFIDMSLLGVISPSTLGIDLKKTDNAESQREKEKATLYTRDSIITVLEKVVPELIKRILYAMDVIRGSEIHDYEVSISFGQYASPSFDTLLTTVGAAREKNIISVEWAVEELWGDSKTPEEKQQEVDRIKSQLTSPVPEKEIISPPTPASVHILPTAK